MDNIQKQFPLITKNLELLVEHVHDKKNLSFFAVSAVDLERKLENLEQAFAALELVKSIARLDHRIFWQNEAREVLKMQK